MPDRSALARYGLMIGNVQEVISTALGGETTTTTVEGRERYGVNIRYPRDFRSNPTAIASEVLVPLPRGGTVPLGEVAKVELVRDPTSIRTENGQLAKADLHEAIMLGAVERMRPKMTTVVAIMAGLLPILWSTGAGSELMQRIAVPMIGGMVSSTR